MFCEKCGNLLKNNKCQCGFIKYFNPIPVAIALIPILKENNIFLLGVRRNIDPMKGHLALVGGFQEIEDIKSALIREVKEESGLLVEVDETKPPQVYSSEPLPNRLLVFLVTKPVNFEMVDWSFKNEETQSLELIDIKTHLAFPLHEKAARIFFTKK